MKGSDILAIVMAGSMLIFIGFVLGRIARKAPTPPKSEPKDEPKAETVVEAGERICIAIALMRRAGYEDFIAWSWNTVSARWSFGALTEDIFKHYPSAQIIKTATFEIALAPTVQTQAEEASVMSDDDGQRDNDGSPKGRDSKAGSTAKPRQRGPKASPPPSPETPYA